MSTREALIDGDILAWRIGAGSEGLSQKHIHRLVDKTINNILRNTNADIYTVFFSDPTGANYRKDIFPLYKANRKAPKPSNHPIVVDSIYMQDDEGTNVVFASNEEADDKIGIAMTDSVEGHTTICCSIDKDLLQIPGEHYNWVRNEHKTIDEETARNNFWTQVLVGDSTDNITGLVGLGCPGVGTKRSWKILEGCHTEAEYYRETLAAYTRSLAKNDYEFVEICARLLVTGQLVKIRRYKGEIWTPPIITPKEPTNP